MAEQATLRRSTVLPNGSEGHFRIRAKEARPTSMTDPNDRMGVTRIDVGGPGRDR